MGSHIRSYLEDSLTGIVPDGAVGDNMSASTGYDMAGLPKRGGLNEFSGSYVPDSVQAGMLGGAEYYRAYRESEMARQAPDMLARSVNSSWDDGFVQMITPDKPAPVSLAGYDVLGPQSFTTNTRNMTLDLRGEAAAAPQINSESQVPMGGAMPAYALGTTEAVRKTVDPTVVGTSDGNQVGSIRGGRVSTVYYGVKPQVKVAVAPSAVKSGLCTLKRFC